MIQEIALLHIRPGQTTEFEAAFADAQRIIASMKGHLRHELQRCLEDDHKYALLVWWNMLEDHTQGFRGSPECAEWRSLLHHFYDPFPTVEHYEQVNL
ncbi:antibiotic biosynthesis monooxygenase family protein [Deinococcus arenicola]|uniref:Antibiotic biosynthesis monooxygenase n=1 Tax=Deinococcus arenicola TaxID=2994950 RepID=A0ABU4DTU3_9DEIO|nr:antibiotic biosynthesis monooxygenase [Deinococcus sp. ZS9-10]MDV6375808.1 antibiotic biosynthesis monooxygenase [Deinococcus sp. ZS9-10]